MKTLFYDNVNHLRHTLYFGIPVFINFYKTLTLQCPAKVNREFTKDWAVAPQVLLFKAALEKNGVFFF